MKVSDALNILAMSADAEARSTAALVELVAVATVVAVAPPKGQDVIEIKLSQADFEEAGTNFVSEATYDEAGTMTLRITPIDTE